MQKNGPKERLFVDPGHFYSPICARKAARLYLESEHLALQTRHADGLIDFTAMAALWHRISDHLVEFPETGSAGFRYYCRNTQFGLIDASILSGMLNWINPARIIEIGAGFSSAAAFDTLDRMAAPRLQSFVTIDPDLSRIQRLSPPPSAELISAPVQSVPIERFKALGAGDILFIDSSHVLKTGSDVHYEYLHILAALKPGVIIHIHDIFYPFEYPPNWVVRENRSWNEIYLVDMLLTHSNSYKILFFNDAFMTKIMHLHRKPGDVFDRFEAMTSAGPRWVSGSLWLQKT